MNPQPVIGRGFPAHENTDDSFAASTPLVPAASIDLEALNFCPLYGIGFKDVP
jgi:hypothetical protein